ncbi:unnamed protein product [Vitrella brassicaformis CCMP3155]|uniref:SCP domain-containing protein n=2 Tax=Vitrella brassicaformis TaxID=1169539 RepID=A0A0G4EZL9_VITBC|nr:unnamed protein product [Vitrella brassicaformis CCMP3155]|eukprot:CEM04940.1 unnamed protein product [Vitrella brassicaformis CCMP3155]
MLPEGEMYDDSKAALDERRRVPRPRLEEPATDNNGRRNSSASVSDDPPHIDTPTGRLRGPGDGESRLDQDRDEDDDTVVWLAGAVWNLTSIEDSEKRSKAIKILHTIVNNLLLDFDKYSSLKASTTAFQTHIAPHADCLQVLLCVGFEESSGVWRAGSPERHLPNIWLAKMLLEDLKTELSIIPSRSPCRSNTPNPESSSADDFLAASRRVQQDGGKLSREQLAELHAKRLEKGGGGRGVPASGMRAREPVRLGGRQSGVGRGQVDLQGQREAYIAASRAKYKSRWPANGGGPKIRDADGKWIPYVPAAPRTERDSSLPAEERARPPPGSLRELGERDKRLDSTPQWDRDGTVYLGFKALEYTNDFRRMNRLPQLEWSQALCRIAAEHSRAMLSGNVPFGHQGSDRRFSSYPFPSVSAAENVAWNSGHSGDASARVCVDSWIGSDGHRKNMLGEFNVCGIGVARDAGGRTYFTQLFGHRMSGVYQEQPTVRNS